MEMEDPGDTEVIQSLFSFFLIKNSHVPGTDEVVVGSGPAAMSASFVFFAEGEIGFGGMPVGALAIARKIGLALSSMTIISCDKQYKDMDGDSEFCFDKVEMTRCVTVDSCTYVPPAGLT
jgi:hypothetical protein